MKWSAAAGKRSARGGHAAPGERDARGGRGRLSGVRYRRCHRDRLEWAEKIVVLAERKEKKSVSSITDRLSLKLDNRISETVYNALYVETFSALELFMADTLLSLIFSNEECYKNAVAFYIKESGRTKEIKKEELIDKVHTFFFKNIVYHSFSRVSRAFFQLTGKKLPQAKELNMLLHLRHNIVHRHSMDGFSRMRVTSATKESVEQLLQTIRVFAQSLMESLSKWN